MITLRKTLFAVLAALALVVGVVAAAQSVATTSAPGGAVNFYETPCYHKERVTRGIPAPTLDDSKGYAAWYRAHWGSPEWTAWNAAASACFRDHPVAKWDWDAMVLVRTENPR